jgi:hypothetical protein
MFVGQMSLVQKFGRHLFSTHFVIIISFTGFVCQQAFGNQHSRADIQKTSYGQV